MQAKLQAPLPVARSRVADRLPSAPVPEHDRAAAVLPLGDDTFEASVLDRVVLDVHREPLGRRVHTGTLGNGPTLERAVELEPEVVVQPPCGVLLNHVEA